MKEKKFNYKIGLVIILILLRLATIGSSNSKPSGISAGDLIDYAEKKDELQVELVRTVLKDDFDKTYANGLYYEDYSAEKKELDTYFSEQMEIVFEEFVKLKIDGFMLKRMTNIPYYYISDNEYYKSSLKEYREGKLSKEDFFSNMNEHIRLINCSFYIPDVKGIYIDSYEFYIKKYFEEECGFYRYLYQSILFKRDYYLSCSENYDFRNIENIFDYMVENDLIQSIDACTAFKHRFTDLDIYNSTIEELEKLFNEEFVYKGFKYSEDYFDDYFAPKSDENLLFQANGTNNRYLRVRAQKAYYEEVEKIINEEGYGSKIAYITIPDDDGYFDPDRLSYDMSGEVDNLHFINEGFRGNYDTTLILMLEEDEEIDYEKLRNIIYRISDIICMYYDNQEPIYDKEGHNRSDIFIFPYRLKAEDKRIVLDLFDKDRYTENYNRGSTGIANIYADMFKVRAETEGFHYLDIYGEKMEFLISVDGNKNDFIKSLEIDEFIEKFRTTNLFGEKYKDTN